MTTRVPLQIITLEKGSYHILVDGMINDVESRFIIDTGASKTVIDWSIDGLVFNRQDKEPLISATLDNDEIETKHTRVERFSIGDMDIGEIDLVGIDLSNVNHVYKEHADVTVQGLIGCDLLYRYRGIIDIRKRELLLSG